MASHPGPNGSENGWQYLPHRRIPPTLPTHWFLPRGTPSPTPSQPVFWALAQNRSRSATPDALRLAPVPNQPTRCVNHRERPYSAVCQGVDRGRGVQGRGRTLPPSPSHPGEPRHHLLSPLDGRKTGDVPTAMSHLDGDRTVESADAPILARARAASGTTDGGNGRRRIFAILIPPSPCRPKEGADLPGYPGPQGYDSLLGAKTPTRGRPALGRGFAGSSALAVAVSESGDRTSTPYGWESFP